MNSWRNMNSSKSKNIWKCYELLCNMGVFWVFLKYRQFLESKEHLGNFGTLFCDGNEHLWNTLCSNLHKQFFCENSTANPLYEITSMLADGYHAVYWTMELHPSLLAVCVHFIYVLGSFKVISQKKTFF